jgi:hypothetical protein
MNTGFRRGPDPYRNCLQQRGLEVGGEHGPNTVEWHNGRMAPSILGSSVGSGWSKLVLEYRTLARRLFYKATHGYITSVHYDSNTLWNSNKTNSFNDGALL